VTGVFRLITRPVASYRRRDRILAGQAAVILLGQLGAWLIVFYVGYALLIWPVTGGIGTAFTSAAVRRLQPPGERDRAAELPGRLAIVGT